MAGRAAGSAGRSPGPRRRPAAIRAWRRRCRSHGRQRLAAPARAVFGRFHGGTHRNGLSRGTELVNTRRRRVRARVRGRHERLGHHHAAGLPRPSSGAVRVPEGNATDPVPDGAAGQLRRPGRRCQLPDALGRRTQPRGLPRGQWPRPGAAARRLARVPRSLAAILDARLLPFREPARQATLVREDAAARPALAGTGRQCFRQRGSSTSSGTAAIARCPFTAAGNASRS